MNWYRNSILVNRLAASYVLGTLQGKARARFETLLRHNPAAAQAVAAWSQRLSPLLITLTPMAPRSAVWDAIEQRSGIAPTGNAHRSW